MSMNPQRPRAPLPSLLSRFSRPAPHRQPTRQGPALKPHTSPAEACAMAELRDGLLDDLRAAGATDAVLDAARHHVGEISRVTAAAASQQALAEGARQRLMNALRFAVSANPEGSTLLRSENTRAKREIARLQTTLRERESQLQLLEGGVPKRFFASLGRSITNDCRDVLNKLDSLEASLSRTGSSEVRPLIQSIRAMCESLEEYGESALANAS